MFRAQLHTGLSTLTIFSASNVDEIDVGPSIKIVLFSMSYICVAAKSVNGVCLVSDEQHGVVGVPAEGAALARVRAVVHVVGALGRGAVRIAETRTLAGTALSR
jgi:hypothetical protein